MSQPVVTHPTGCARLARACTFLLRRAIVPTLFVLGAPACAASPQPVPNVPSSPERVAQPAAALPGLPPLTPHESELALRLQSEVQALVELGSRSFQDGWNLAEATDHLAGRLEGLGYELKRRGFEWNGELGQNLEVELPGAGRGDEIVIVAANFVSPKGSPGADDSASGTATLLALARELRAVKRQRRIRFVFLSTAGPLEQLEAQGSFRYPQQVLDERGEGGNVVAAIELHGLGVYSDGAQAQQSPEALTAMGLGTPGKADFIALVSTPSSTELAQNAADALVNSASLPVKSWVLPPADPFWRSAHGEFARAGMPAVLVTDTLALRSTTPGGAGDTSQTLDYGRMARVVAGLEQLITRLAGVPPADGDTTAETP